MLLRCAATVLVASLGSPIGAQQASAARDDFRQAMARHDFTQAFAIGQSEIATLPASASGWFEQGLALLALHRPLEALRVLDKAHSLAPQDLLAAQAAAQAAYQLHDARALGYVESVLSLDPSSIAAHGMAGVLQLEGGHCDTAAAHLMKPEVTPLLDNGTRTRLAACIKTAQPASAIALLAPLRSTATLSAAGYGLLGSAYIAVDQVPLAVETLREGCERFPQTADLFADLAILSMDHQSPEVALGVLNAGLIGNANAAELYTLRGSVYAQLAETVRATADFEHADALSPKEAFGALGLGMLLRDGSNLEEAQRRLESKLKDLPGDPLLSYTLADVLIRQGAKPGDANFTRAEQLLHTALARNESLAQAYALLGKLELRRNDLPAATHDLERAVQLNEHDRTALNQLIAAYRRSGHSADATRVSEQLARSADEERRRETENNRIHLTLGDVEKQYTVTQP